MSRLQRALAGQRSCPPCYGDCNQGRACPARIPTRDTWLDRRINRMRAAYLRHLIDIGEQRVVQLEAEIRANDADLERLRVELALVES